MTGLEGDEQGDRRHHGGPEKAVHHYPLEHYTLWRSELPDIRDHLVAGGFGENFSTVGWTEAEVCVGDIVVAGSAILQVSQARQPCWRLNARFGTKDMARRVQATLRTGWYYRVLKPGAVRAGEHLSIIERRHPDWPLKRLLETLYIDRMNLEALAEMARLEALTPSWRELATTRLRHGIVEDWTKRLEGSTEH